MARPDYLHWPESQRGARGDKKLIYYTGLVCAESLFQGTQVQGSCGMVRSRTVRQDAVLI